MPSAIAGEGVEVWCCGLTGCSHGLYAGRFRACLAEQRGEHKSQHDSIHSLTVSSALGSAA